MKTDALEFKRTTSRGVNTFGYGIVSLYVNGKKEFSTCGGGYDMKGTVFADYIKRYHLPRLLDKKGNSGSLDDGTGYYGLGFFSPKGERHKEYKDGDSIYLEGGCGFESIVRIAEACDITINRVTDTVYTATYNPLCSHYQCHNSISEGKGGACYHHTFCNCKKIEGRHYKESCDNNDN